MSAVAFNLYRLANTCCVVVGLGLIGKSIAKHISHYGLQIHNVTTQFSWTQADEIADTINLLAQSTGRKQLELIWSSGHAGFSATDDEMNDEYNIFSEVTKRLAMKHGENLTINFLSSAGGIYEGLEYINNLVEVSPVRPYGEWKLKQEELLLSMQIPVRLYRISSAYGFALGKSRFGLINNLINSSLTNKNTLIYANPSTLRDYVFTQDIARFITENIIESKPPGTHIVASGRAVSVDMLINSISQLLRKRVKVSYSPSKTNSKNIVFPTRLLPHNLMITPLEESIRTISINRFFSQ